MVRFVETSTQEVRAPDQIGGFSFATASCLKADPHPRQQTGMLLAANVSYAPIAVIEDVRSATRKRTFVQASGCDRSSRAASGVSQRVADVLKSDTLRRTLDGQNT
jgi:hypothetical protein